MKTGSVKEAIEKLEDLSTIPIVLTRIVKATSDPSASPAELYSILAKDQALAEKTIRIANSPFFGHSDGISDIHQAILFLGYENIRNIAVSVGVMSMPSKRGDMNLRNFWAHSYEVGIIAAAVAEIATMISPQTAFLTGLLHDIGRLLFYDLFQDKYREIRGMDDLIEKELEIFGCDHGAAGGWFAEKARLPKEHVLAIRYHHSPSMATELNDHVAVVALAEALSRRYNPRIEDDGIWKEEYDAILLELALTNADITDIGERLKEEETKIRDFLSLI
ncbi:MAG: HDOD domain-containing protein [Nitrospirales bacterium]|nr:HDOD domain-containing protein [Nitrospirales bacterium]